MTGGMIWPPVEATASTAPATSWRYPFFFINGIVMIPVVTTFDTAVPEMVPNRVLPKTATLAGPPRYLPIKAMARSVKKAPPPVAKSDWPSKTKGSTIPAATTRGSPSRAFVSRYR